MLVMSILFTLHVGASYVSYYPSRQLAYRAVTKLLHPRLSLASLWMVPRLWFIFFISASTVLRQVVLNCASIFPLGSSGLQLW